MFYPGVPDILHYPVMHYPVMYYPVMHYPVSLLICICTPIVDILPSLRQNLGYLLDLDSLV